MQKISAEDWIWARIKVTPQFPIPSFRNPEFMPPDAVPEDLAGATIVQLGMANDGSQLDGGGLVIDYLPRGSTTPVRLVLAFNEGGMWKHYLGPIATPAEPA